VIVNEEDKSAEIEPRDINYILSAYVRLYLFQSKNEDPERIILPMFQSVPHPYKPNVQVPIVYVPDTSPEALRIIHDGSNVPETTPESEATADDREAEYEAMKARIAELESIVEGGNMATAEDLEQEAADRQLEEDTEAASLAQVALAAEREASRAAEEALTPAPDAAMDSIAPSPERIAKAKQPDVVLPPGTDSDYGGRRDGKADQKQVAKDLMPRPDINEGEERDASDIVERAKGEKKDQ